MDKLGQIGGNAYEDFIDEYFSIHVYQQYKTIFGPLLKEFEGDSPFNEAMRSAITTLSFGMVAYTLRKLNGFFFDRLGKTMTAMYAYIVAGKIQKKLKEYLKQKNFRGKKALKAVGLVLDADRTPQRIEMMKLVQSNVDNYDKHKLDYQSIYSSQQKNMNDMTNTASNMRSDYYQTAITKFTHKFRTAEWTKTTDDKKLFEKVTGKKFGTSGLVWNRAMIDKLNSYSDFIITAEGKAINSATASNSLMTALGIKN